jgi:hypothetical protein
MDDQAGGAQWLGEVETIEVGLTLAEGKDLLSAPQRLVL